MTGPEPAVEVLASDSIHHSLPLDHSHTSPNGRAGVNRYDTQQTLHATDIGGGYTRAPHCDADCMLAVYSSALAAEAVYSFASIHVWTRS